MQTIRIPFIQRLLPAAFLLLAACATTSPPVPPAGDAAATPPLAPQPAAPAPRPSYVEQQHEALTAQLADAVRQGALEIDSPRANVLEITLPADPDFIEDSAQLRPAAQMMLGRLAAILLRFDRTTMVIVGYSDNAGSPAQDLQLSMARARQVAQSLATRGVSPSRMQVTGRGMENPRASNRTEFGRALNRRIQITILPAQAG